MAAQDNAREWQCGATSTAWALRLESLVCVLDVEGCPLDANGSQVECSFAVLLSHYCTLIR